MTACTMLTLVCHLACMLEREGGGGGGGASVQLLTC